MVDHLITGEYKMSVKVCKKEIRTSILQYERKWRRSRRSKCKLVSRKLPLMCHPFECKRHFTNRFLTRVLQRRYNRFSFKFLSNAIIKRWH
jgi:hypothetical protein